MIPEAEGTLRDMQVDITSQVSLNEEGSGNVCIANKLPSGSSTTKTGEPDPSGNCTSGNKVFGPKAALLGTVNNLGSKPVGNPLTWSDTSDPGINLPVTLSNKEDTLQVRVSENPAVGDTQDWQIYNFTEDAHPIHIHLVRFEVIRREAIPTRPSDCPPPKPPQAHESGFKDTVICYPDEITTVRAKFDVAGLYVWHCHILEHEDNEMMRPYIVSPFTPCPDVPAKP
jgi:FtsP/CotA-like multicopper oxidase with cupredoxin domain